MNLRLYIPRFVVCWRFGAAGFEWCPCCWLKHNWSVHVLCGGWGHALDDGCINVRNMLSTLEVK